MDKQVALQNQKRSRTRICSRPLSVQYLHSGFSGNVGQAVDVRWRRRSDRLAPTLGKWTWEYAGEGQNGQLSPPPEIGTKKENFLENVKSAV